MDSFVESKKEKVEGSERRTFIKKAFYSTPVLVGLGQMVKPSSAHADSTTIPPHPDR